ncbi:MAG: hypothetical protein K6G83_06995 [Lachnospiraceae bacterium]|nr:hypothetical protein [Lachnospiraceae bacterium]
MDLGVNGRAVAYQNVIGRTKASNKEGADKAGNVIEYKVRYSEMQADSVVEDYKRKHPSDSGNVDKMVNSGLRAREMYGASGIDTSEMTMDEYKDYITDILGKIPFHASHPYDEEVIYISEAGWEQMKNDPEYEAWVLGYNVENRAVPNPFFGMGDMGMYGVEHFGATIEEHHGEGYSKVYGGTAAGARSMFEGMASGKGAIRNKASKAGLQPPEDWSLEEEQRKARKKNKELWDEIFEARLRVKKDNDSRFTKKRLEEMRLSMMGLGTGGSYAHRNL